ncbi:MAG: hypothetical protein ACYDCD_03065 [Candidatus Acidiferrales bacterium]
MHKLGFSFLLVAVMASTSTAQSANQQYRPNDRQQSQSRQSRAAKSSPSSSKQGGPQGAVSASASNSGSASANAGGNSANLSSGTAINAELLTTLDARKCHPGQRVIAKTTQDVKQDGHVVMRRGTRLIGHVTEAQAKTKANTESAVGIAFDQAEIKKGQEVPFHAAIQAVAAAQTMSAASLDNDMMEPSGPPMGSGGGAMGGSMGGGAIGGIGSGVGSAAGTAGNMAGNLPRTAGGAIGATSATAASAGGSLRGLNAAGQLTSTSNGVIGMKGLNLTSAASNSTEGSVITSAKRNVHLSSGTQMLLKVHGQ